MTKKKKTETPVVVENPDNLPSALFDDAKIDIKGLIRVIRGQQVMLDFDLAMLYGEKTSRLNEQVKRNIERFPDDFMFQLTKAEQDYLRTELIERNSLMSQNEMSNLSGNQQDADWISQNATSNSVKKGFRKVVSTLQLFRFASFCGDFKKRVLLSSDFFHPFASKILRFQKIWT